MKVNIHLATPNELTTALSLLDLLSKTKSEQKIAIGVYRRISKGDFYFLFVAKIEEKVIGTASIFLIPSLSHRRPWGYIDNLVVAKRYRKKGIGRKLVEVLLNFAKEKNCYKVILTSRFPRREVHQFWQRLGFEKHGYSFRKDL